MGELGFIRKGLASQTQNALTGRETGDLRLSRDISF